MTPEDKLKKIVGTEGGMRLPEGYFPDVMQRISASLPEHPMQNAEQPVRYSWWVKTRPIVYMAAMFAGIWLMMKVFTTVSTTTTDVVVENTPALMAGAMDNADDMRQMMASAPVDEIEVVEDIMVGYGGDFAKFAEEFNNVN